MNLNQLINKYTDIEQKEILLLLEYILDTSYSRLLLADDIQINKEQQSRLESYIQRLKNDEPIQYILGSWDFIDLNLKVDKRALIPRPETEILAQEGVNLVRKFENPRVLDIGCGTGCIGLYIKHKLPNAQITLCDISEDAIFLAQENARRLNLDVNFLHRDMKDIDEVYDLIISNPPYITTEDITSLDKSVIEYEPENALHGGEDGLDYYRILSAMHKNLNECGYLALEIGIKQDKPVKELLENNFKDIKIIKDFADIPRIITAKCK